MSGNVLISLAAAVLWGGGDFSGGMGVKSSGGSVRAAVRVVLLSHLCSLCVLLLLIRVRGDAAPHGPLLAWGLAAGVAGGLSLTCFYIALSRGAMGASAALSGLLAAAIPAAVAMSSQGSPGAAPLLGFALAAVAIWLIAAGPPTAGQVVRRETLALALVAGVGFGVYFVALKQAGPAGVLWPMACARVGSLTTCSLVWLALRLAAPANQAVNPAAAPAAAPAPHRISASARRTLAWVLATALLDTSGNLLFVSATRVGRLDVAAVLASLYPASTILLAAAVLREWPTRRQAAGFVVAALAVGLIALQ